MTIYIIIITAIVSLVALNNEKLRQQFMHNPYLVKHNKQWYRLISSGFLHADFFHLFVNLFVLYSFGNVVEFYYKSIFGTYSGVIYLLLYVSAIYASSLSTQYKYQNSPSYNSLGASGAVSAVVFASVLFAPYNKIYLYGIIGLPGILLAIAYLSYSYYMGKKQVDNTNHEAHFYGAVYGLIFTLVLKPKVALIFLHQLLRF